MLFALGYFASLVSLVPAAAQDAETNADNTELAESQEVAETQDAGSEVDEILAGHSYHGEAFNEGPRQQAYLMGGTGNCSFPVSVFDESVRGEVQAFVNQGIGQLHGFWDLEAERTFRQAAALDPQCAMAYWGAALAANADRDRARGFIEKAQELKEALGDKLTRREQMYIDALADYLKKSRKKKRARRLVARPRSRGRRTI